MWKALGGGLVAGLLIVAWLAWGEHQDRKEYERREQAANDAFLEDQKRQCRRVVAAWDEGDEAPARAMFSDVPTGMKACRTLLK